MKASASQNFFTRNLGFISEDEQAIISSTRILIAGTGGDGGLLAERLVRTGIKKIILADPDVFEESNINRQFAAYQKNIGRNKAEAVADELLQINPALEIELVNEGVTKENINHLVSLADVIVDEIEYSLPSVSVMLHREAFRQNKYVFMAANIGWGASVFCFSPNGKSFEEHFEFNKEHQSINPLRYLKTLPSYINNELKLQVLEGCIPMPSLSSSVGLAASVLSNEIIFFITKKRMPLIVPQFLSIDLFDLSIDKS
ncbi:MAG: ThiF family adenylyltransferase [Chitinophagales bacterium]